MGAGDVSLVLKALEQLQLSDEDIAVLQGVLACLVQPGHCLRLIEEAAAKNRSCPDCGSHRCHRCGHANGLQRYRCVACLRSFNALTGTPLARLRLRDKWLLYGRLPFARHFFSVSDEESCSSISGPLRGDAAGLDEIR